MMQKSLPHGQLRTKILRRVNRLHVPHKITQKRRIYVLRLSGSKISRFHHRTEYSSLQIFEGVFEKFLYPLCGTEVWGDVEIPFILYLGCAQHITSLLGFYLKIFWQGYGILNFLKMESESL